MKINNFQKGWNADKMKINRFFSGYFLIFLSALSFRILILWLLKHSDYSLALVLDASSYDQWAREILAGNWLARAPFYQDPLYPYFAAILYKIIGYHPEALRALQMVWGSFSCVLIAAATTRISSSGAGIIAGLMAAVCGPVAFFDILLLKTSLGFFLVSLSLYLLLTFGDNRLGKAAAAGFCLGLAVLVRANMLVFIPAALVYLGWRILKKRKDYPGVLKAAGIFILSVALAIAPFTLINLKAGGEFILTTSQLGPNLYQGNNEKIVAAGRYSPPDFLRADPKFEAGDYADRAKMETGHRMTPRAVSAYWSGRALDFMGENLPRFISYTLKKTFVLLNGYEVPDNYNIYVAAEQGGAPFLLWLGWPVFLALGLGGMALSLIDRHGKDETLLLISFFVLYAFGLTVFFTFARYRLPLYIPLLVFSGVAAEQLRKIPRTLFKPSVAVLVLFGGVIGFWPVEHENPANEYLNRAVAQIENGDTQAAEKNLLEAMKLNPADGKVHYNLGSLYLQQGKFPEAEKHLTRAAGLLPEDWSTWNNLGIALRQNGKLPLAMKSHQKALALSPDNPEILVNLALCYGSEGETDRAVETLKKVTELDPGRASAYANLGVILAGRKNYREAEPYLEKADSLEPGNMMILGNLADVKRALGETSAAIGIYERMLKLDNGQYRERIMRSLAECRRVAGGE